MNMQFASPQMLPDWLNRPHCEGIEIEFSITRNGVPIAPGRAAVTVADYGGGNLEPVYFAVQSLDDPDQWVPLKGGDPLHRCLDDDLRDDINRAFDQDSYAKAEASEKIAKFIESHLEDRRAFG